MLGPHINFYASEISYLLKHLVLGLGPDIQLTRTKEQVTVVTWDT